MPQHIKGLKKQKLLGKFDTCKDGKKNEKAGEKVDCSPPPSSSGESSGEQSSDGASSKIFIKEPSIYDNLLMTLRSCNKSLANAYNKRKRQEEGKSDTEDDNVDGSTSISVSDEEDDNSKEGTDYESHRSHMMDSILQEPSAVGDQNRDADIEDDFVASDADQDYDNGQFDSKASLSTSAFSEHLGHKITKEEVDDLPKGKWKYKWESTATGIPNCKWKGTGECFLRDCEMESQYGLKPKLYKYWLDTYKKSGGKDFHSSKQRSFFSLCNSYRDILHCNKRPFYNKGSDEDATIMDGYLMHSLNHILRTRDLVTKNDARMVKHQDATEEIFSSDGFLDQGFTRPKVLILLPLRSIAFRVVKRLIQLTPNAHKVNVEDLERFCDEFGTGRDMNEEDKNKSQDTFDDENLNSQKSSKPADFQVLFGGNSDDEFMIGIKFTRRSIKLYGDFYSSDMIIASPVKLHMMIEKAEKEKELDVDYLSSIEVLIIDHADIISMQNWSFLTSVVEQLNRIPSKQHGTDVMRIRQWYLDGHAQFYRQTILLSYYLTPGMNALFNRHCTNYKGKVKLVCEHKGVLQKVLLQVRQIYERFDADSIVDADNARYEYFSKKVFPKIKDSLQGGTMIFLNSYFDFVRLRKFLKLQNASFCLLGEYTKPSNISRARVWFFEGRRKIMLYTERAYFYKRYKIRGIKNLIIYSLPERKEFYPEIVNMLEGSNDMTATVLFSRYDQLQLERIVGSTSAKRMINSEKNVFLFS